MLVFAIAGDIVIPITQETAADATAPLVDVVHRRRHGGVLHCRSRQHGLCATALRRLYEADLSAGRNRIRWAEFAVSAPLSTLLIALYAGVTDVTALVVIGAATLVMIVCGWMQEA